MPVIQFLKKKMGQSHLIWLKKGNKYILLEEPAWFVFNKLARSYSSAGIARQCAARYGITLEESVTFVEDIKVAILQMNQPSVNEADGGNFPVELSNYSFKASSVYHYRFANSVIKFSYETAHFESYLHPLISHLSTLETTGEPSHFELFDYGGQIVFRLNGEVKGVWSYEESNLVKGLIFMSLVNVMFEKEEDFWLMTVHASAVSNGKKTILISASPGSGKTTMAAMLQNKGYRMVSDDFVPIDRISLLAWPFPIAMSVKPGAVDLLSTLYPSLEQQPVNYITAEKSVRYLFPHQTGEATGQAFPVKEFIFIQYNETVDFEFEKLDQVQAVKRLLDQSWISPTPGNAEILLHQISQWSFYQLTYSNNQKAMEDITQLFSHD